MMYSLAECLLKGVSGWWEFRSLSFDMCEPRDACRGVDRLLKGEVLGYCYVGMEIPNFRVPSWGC